MLHAHRRTRTAVVLLAALLLFAAACAATDSSAHAQRARFEPEAATGFDGKRVAIANDFMVAAANPLAVDAGIEILRRGGSATDAAIAVQLVLNLVEPQSSGIGGGAFLLHWNAGAQSLTTYDGRETAPAAATPDRFLKDGNRMAFRTAVHSGLSIGTPGLVRMLADVHAKHGKLAWAELFAPAIKLAVDGFPVSPRLNGLLTRYGASAFDEAARAYFFEASGGPIPVGFKRQNLAFAATLRAIAERGPAAFYEGDIARAIVSAVRNAPNAAGDLTLEDLAGYRAVQRAPVCSAYRGYRICGMGPPSSGALTVAQTLKLIEPMPIVREPAARMAPRVLHALAEAQKRAYADRGRYMADPDFVRVPPGLLDTGYLDGRRKEIDMRRAARGRVSPGVPPDTRADAFGIDATRESVGTSHISIVDRDGNAVSMTTTIESAFGARVWAAGFLLNNELTDFSFRPVDDAGRPIANAVAPNKRPRSSMAPTLVFDPEGRLFAALGSPGGSRIILYVTKALVGLIDWQLDPQTVAEMANFGSRGGPFELEVTSGQTMSLSRLQSLLSPTGKPAIWHAIRMRGYGHTIRPDAMTSGLHIIVQRDGRLYGGADPRREGVARGE
ncbi:MAG: gamma-glutamyltransferase family protein [Pseudomonadota bacterium]